MKTLVLTLVILAVISECLALPEGQRHGRRQGRRGGRRQNGRQQRFRAGRQQALTRDNGGLGPPPQPEIDFPAPAAAPLPVQSATPNRFQPPGPQPGDSFPPESPIRGRIPDRDGNYEFEFEDDDGSFRREIGSVKNLGAEDANEITGEVSWISPEGETISFTYQADENGYQAQGSHLPQAPPLHPHIQRGLELIARVNQRNNRN